ncbi:MAG: coproporphyrinogen dehydrogenase HemZ [Clostridia bacterium]|nr:coproporphyrinogen dehydrogenase HemZ [Clostridia bacterium]
MKCRLACEDEKLYNDLMDLVRAYYPYVEWDEAGEVLAVSAEETDRYAVEVRFGGRVWKDEQSCWEDGNPLLRLRHYKWFVKKTVYNALRETTGVALPYGSLTGIRPTKLYYEMRDEGLDSHAMLLDYFGVSERKVRLIEDIVEAQKGIYNVDTDAFDHFANIPVCPTRCAYCSFIAETYQKVKKQMDDYARNLARGVRSFFDLGVRRRAIYVGGGTPTSIPDYQLEEILTAFDAKGEEFTVEAGRPETIRKENVAVMKAAGVTRASVNPQTFKEETLRKIGRAHTVRDIYRAYDLVKDKFDVNMDLIAMLPDETLDDFAATLEKTIELEPENITVHSLSVKRGSNLMLAGYDSAQNNALAMEMSDYAYTRLKEAGYAPYYMYRQKNTQGRLENVGYTKRGKACVYNVDIMEETHSVHASGAGAISKRVFAEMGRIERLSEIKEIKGFNERIEEVLEKKKSFFA